MQLPTYKLLLTKSKAAVSDIEMEKVTHALVMVPPKDYFMAVNHTPFNPVCGYTLSITVLRRDKEEAKALADEIKKLLLNEGIISVIEDAMLLWDENINKFYYPIG